MCIWAERASSHKDLDLIAKMGKLVTTRAENKEISHKVVLSIAICRQIECKLEHRRVVWPC